MSLDRAERMLLHTRPPPANLYSDAFAPQLALCREPATFATALCSRRAGKSEAIARLLLTESERAPCLYFTRTRADAKRIIWPILRGLVSTHGLPVELHESELVVKRGGTPRIYLTGCDNQTEIGKMRGSGWGYVAGDEAQLFPAYLKPLVEETLTPALMDHRGRLLLAGTPGPVPMGYFYDMVRSSEWAHHSWTAFDNPHVNASELLAKALKLRGITEQHPSIQREFYGRWAYDATALVFAWSQANHYDAAPALTDYVIGVDLGFDDADAICVLGWTEKSPVLYLVEEHVLAKQSITQLTERLHAMHAKYLPLATVVDTGGLGKKIADEVSRRTGLPLQAADKARKLEHIELLNDALRTGNLRARSDSRFAQDSLLVEWDRSNPERPKISSRYHSDICDSVLYAYVRALHWLHTPEPVKPTIEQQRELDIEAIWEQHEHSIEQQQEDDHWI